MTVTMDMSDWGNAGTTAWSNFSDDVQNSIPKDTSALLGEKRKD